MNEKEKYISLIQKKLIEDLTETEENELIQLKLKIDKDEEIYNEYYKLWNSLNIKSPKSVFQKEKVWNKLDSQLNFRDLDYKNHRSYKTSSTKWIAAAILLIFSATLLRIVLSEKYISRSTGEGEILKINLPDNSIAILNENSNLEYLISEEAKKRNLILEGECYFDVSKNGKPFVVETENSVIKVLGTEFNVLSDDSLTTLTVVEGKVSFRNVLSKNEKILTQNMTSTILRDSDAKYPRYIDADSLSSWRYGEFSFENESLKEVLFKLKNSYKFEYEVLDNEILELKLTAKFKNKKLDVILKSISVLLKIEYKKIGNKFIFKSINE